jgi:hypothetical protein
LKPRARTPSWAAAAATGVVAAVARGQPAPVDDAPALPAPESHPQLEIVRTETPPAIDGVLDEPAWGRAAVIDNLTQVEPVEGAPPTRPTEIRVLYDARFIYFGVRCYDSEPDRIVAKQLRRDGSLDSDDHVRLVIDSIFDRRSGFFFATNPVGARLDGLVVNNRAIAEEWDGIWYAKASIDAEGWVAEIAIPFQTISYDPKTMRWGFNLERIVRRDREISRWSAPSPNIEIQSVANAGVIEGIENITQGIGLDVKPYAKGTYEHDPDGDDHLKGTGGLDLTYKLTPETSLTLTFNTDFAETEVDERRVNLTRFPLFFPEKRDFFLQDAGIFRFGGIRMNPLPFFSRRIGLDENGEPVRILAGAKVTGRPGGWNLGFLSTYMDSTSTVDRKLLSVGRVALNVLDESAVGFIATAGDPLTDDDNWVVGPDFNFRTSDLFGDRVLQGNAFFLYSDTRGGESEVTGDDMTWGFKLDYPNDRIDWSIDVTEIGDDFNAALGFVPRRGIREYIGRWRYRWRPRGTFLRTIDSGLRAELITDLSNDLETRDLTLEFLEITSNAGDSLYFETSFNREVLTDPFEIQPGNVIPVGTYEFARFGAAIETADSRPISAAAWVGAGEFFDGHRLETYLGVEARPSEHLFGSIEWERNDVDLPTGDFVVNVVRARADVLFSPDLSWSNFIQWDDVSESLGFNSRVRWIVEPGNDLFFVVSQAFDTDGTFATTSTEIVSKVVWTFRF